MSTECYAMVRGSALRVTELNRRGGLGDSIRYAVSKSVTRVTINEVTDSGADEIERNEDDQRRLRTVRPTQTIRYTADIEFIRTDPGLLSLITGVPLVHKPSTADAGFGFGPFGLGPFSTSPGDVVGFDSKSKMLPVSFALEVWTRLAGQHCADPGFGASAFGDDPFGGVPGRRWGYTLFPFLKGGRLGGFSFSNGLVSFSVRGAMTRRLPRWGVGPYDLEGPFQRLLTPVSGNAHWRQMITAGQPPNQTDGIVEFIDDIDGGTATLTTDNILDGGTAAMSGPWIIGGGGA